MSFCDYKFAITLSEYILKYLEVTWVLNCFEYKIITVCFLGNRTKELREIFHGVPKKHSQICLGKKRFSFLIMFF